MSSMEECSGALNDLQREKSALCQYCLLSVHIARSIKQNQDSAQGDVIFINRAGFITDTCWIVFFFSVSMHRLPQKPMMMTILRSQGGGFDVLQDFQDLFVLVYLLYNILMYRLSTRERACKVIVNNLFHKYNNHFQEHFICCLFCGEMN